MFVTNICAQTVKKNLSDMSKQNDIVPCKLRRHTQCITKCFKHNPQNCKLYCIECDIPICVFCESALEHRGHNFVDVLTKPEIKKLILQRDFEELKNSIYPKYQKIASNSLFQKDELKNDSQILTRAIDMYGENLHREIDITILKLKSDLCELESKHLAVLNKWENEITHTISEITQCINDLKKY